MKKRNYASLLRRLQAVRAEAHLRTLKAVLQRRLGA